MNNVYKNEKSVDYLEGELFSAYGRIQTLEMEVELLKGEKNKWENRFIELAMSLGKDFKIEDEKNTPKN